MPRESASPTGMLIITTLTQEGFARVSMTHDVQSQIDEIDYAGSLTDLLDLVARWWRTHWGIESDC